MRPTRIAASFIVLASVSFGAPNAHASLAAPWATLSDTCSNILFTQSPTLATDHAAGLAHITAVTGGPLDAGVGAGNVTVGPGDSGWTRTAPGTAGSRIGISMTCPTPSPFTLDFYDVPGSPITFTGRSTHVPDETNSIVAFVAPARTPYAADVTIDQGSLSVTPPEGAATTIASPSKSIDLGVLRAGVQTLNVEALNGPPVTWTLTLRGVPVTVSGVKSTSAFTMPGALQNIDYTTNGDTNITATISGPSGIVRTLAAALAQPLGTSTLTWDSKGEAGTGLPDGAYTITVRSNDAHGGTSSATATITVDGTAPTITTLSENLLNPTGKVGGKVEDAGSGVQQTLVTANADAPAPTSVTSGARDGSWLVTERPTVFAVGATDGWTPGAHTLRVVSFDNAGNRAERNIRFAVRSTTPSTTKSSGSGRSGAWKRCSSDRRNLRTRGGTTCRLAKQVVAQLRWTGHGQGRSTSRYRCRLATIARKRTVTCTKGNHLVRWDISSR